MLNWLGNLLVVIDLFSEDDLKPKLAVSWCRDVQELWNIVSLFFSVLKYTKRLESRIFFLQPGSATWIECQVIG
jgi:hypothetical protein